MSDQVSLVDAIKRARIALEECPGEGQCHGCLQWCTTCGDVDQVCDAAVCHQHRCHVCNTLLTKNEHEWAYETGGYPASCFVCEIAIAMKQAIRENRDELEAADHRRRLINNAVPAALPR